MGVDAMEAASGVAADLPRCVAAGLRLAADPLRQRRTRRGSHGGDLPRGGGRDQQAPSADGDGRLADRGVPAQAGRSLAVGTVSARVGPASQDRPDGCADQPSWGESRCETRGISQETDARSRWSAEWFTMRLFASGEEALPHEPYGQPPIPTSTHPAPPPPAEIISPRPVQAPKVPIALTRGADRVQRAGLPTTPFPPYCYM